jgi:YbbR domain-containing protein
MVTRLRSFKSLFIRNPGLKLLSFVLAVLSFYAIRGATSATVVHEVPVNVEVEEGIAVLSQDPSLVRVTFRGAREDLRALDPGRLTAAVRALASNPGGAETIPVRPRDIQGFSGVSAVQIEPSSVQLTFDREVEKTFAVADPKITGTPLAGTVEVDYEPKTVRVRGPKRRLLEDRLGLVNTEPVDVEGRVASFEKRVRVLVPHESVSRIEPPEITVRVKIVTRSGARTWDDVPVLALLDGRSGVRLHFEPPTVAVTLRGNEELLEKMNPKSIRVFVECEGLDQLGTYELPVNVHVPPRLDLKSTDVEPDAVRVVFSAPEFPDVNDAAVAVPEVEPPRDRVSPEERDPE